MIPADDIVIKGFQSFDADITKDISTAIVVGLILCWTASTNFRIKDVENISLPESFWDEL